MQQRCGKGGPCDWVRGVLPAENSRADGNVQRQRPASPQMECCLCASAQVSLGARINHVVARSIFASCYGLPRSL